MRRVTRLGHAGFACGVALSGTSTVLRGRRLAGLAIVLLSVLYGAVVAWRHRTGREPARSGLVRRANAVGAYVYLGLGLTALCIGLASLTAVLSAG